MCLACEQDAMWFAYLRRRGLITPDGYLVENPPFPFAADPLPPQQPAEQAVQEAAAPEKVSEQDAREGANKTFSCDDPSAE